MKLTPYLSLISSSVSGESSVTFGGSDPATGMALNTVVKTDLSGTFSTSLAMGMRCVTGACIPANRSSEDDLLRRLFSDPRVFLLGVGVRHDLFLVAATLRCWWRDPSMWL